MDSIVILCDGLFPSEPYPLYLLDSAEGVVCCDGALIKYLARYPDRRPLAVVGDMVTPVTGTLSSSTVTVHERSAPW